MSRRHNVEPAAPAHWSTYLPQPQSLKTSPAPGELASPPDLNTPSPLTPITQASPAPGELTCPPDLNTPSPLTPITPQFNYVLDGCRVERIPEVLIIEEDEDKCHSDVDFKVM